MIVLDASALVEMLLQTELGARVEARVLGGDDALHAPHLIDIEAAQALRRIVRLKAVAAARASEAIADLGALGLSRHSHALLLERVWSLRPSLSAYDAAYVALAEALDAPLVTCDDKLAAAHGHRARVEVIR